MFKKTNNNRRERKHERKRNVEQNVVLIVSDIALINYGEMIFCVCSEIEKLNK